MTELATIDHETGEIVQGQQLAVRPRQYVRLTNEQISYIANTEFVPKGLRGNLPAIMACVATGRALGIDDMASLRQISVIDGKPTFAAELMVRLVREKGHSITGESTDTKAIVRGVRADNGDEITVTWTMEMAARAGLVGKQNWQKYPEAMLWARGVSQLCRMLFADVFAGGTYVAEELDGDEELAATSEELPDTPPPVDHKTDNRKATQAQHRKLHALINELTEKHPGTDWEELSKALTLSAFGKHSRAELTVTEMTDLIDALPTADVPFGGG